MNTYTHNGLILGVNLLLFNRTVIKTDITDTSLYRETVFEALHKVPFPSFVTTPRETVLTGYKSQGTKPL